jgi:DNA-binding transcriptional MerR regulator
LHLTPREVRTVVFMDDTDGPPVEQTHSSAGAPHVRVGDVASATGLTVRTLHHYENVGLLEPDSRSAAGHRQYGPNALERLYRITRLRSLGLSLDQVGRALDDPQWDLLHELRAHLDSLDYDLACRNQMRALLARCIADVDQPAPSSTEQPMSDVASARTHQLMEVLSSMENLNETLRRRISILVYEDVAAASQYLVDTFGFVPGEVTMGPDGTAVHAEVFAGDGVIWLHPSSPEFGLASPAELGAATATMAVIVDDVDGHYEFVKGKGGNIAYEPVDQPYGYREYSARDLEGTLWSFMRPL